MSDLTLGLDLGSSSIGWALVDEEGGRILGMGVRVFPEGVDRDTSGAELSKNATRRIARGMRRQIARRARRKRQLRELLVRSGLLPEVALLPREDARRDAWESEQFRLEDPYSLRRRALTERLEPHEMGRVLVHLNQRRGFQSNRKADRGRDRKENSEMLKEISSLQAEMGDRTLGAFLAEKYAADPRALAPENRVRGRHTHRVMLRDEFDRIWTAQQVHHPTVLTDELRQQVERIIFFQRKLYWPKSVIGACELEPRLRRAPRADRRAQRFRLLLEVNNLRVLDRSTGVERALTADERTKLLAYLSAAKERTFDQIRKHLFDEHEGIRFNLEVGERTKLKGLPTDATLSHKTLMGKAWHDLEEWKKNRIVRTIIDGEDEDFEKLRTDLGLSEELIEKLRDVDLEEGYSSYSICAIKKLLPYLEQGYPLTSRDPNTPCALRAAGYLLPWEHKSKVQPFLDEPPVVTNPLVRQALHEVRKVVNAILRELVYRDGHRLARIHIELAREVKGTAEQRMKRIREMRENERRRNAAAEEIRKFGHRATRDSIDKYLLWQEQNHLCIYTGRPISLAQLLSAEVDVDHILPWPRSLDNSMMNRVVCFREANAEKKNRTPWEWLGESDPARYEQILQRADKLPYGKARRFRQKSIELDDFFARQYVDTTYITTQVHQYVQTLGADVLCPKGQHTATLRHHWGLDGVLRHDGLQLKNREDYRHHAVDALVIALTNRRRLQQLAESMRRDAMERTGERLPDPWPNFFQDVQRHVDAIRVSHRVRRKVSGPLHEETIYGPTATPGEFVYRKPVTALTASMVPDIRDAAIRQLVENRLREHGIEPGGKQKIGMEVWRTPLLMPSGVPVRKVRLIRRDLTIQPIRGGSAYVKPGSLHHLCIFEVDLPGGKTRREAVFVSTLEATHRLKRGEPVIQRSHPRDPNARFVMSLSSGEMVLGTFKGRERLVRFITAASTQGQIYFVDHCDARPGSTREKFAVKANTLRGRKVTVDPIGRIRWAND